jgi:hypothetical protein
VIAAKLGARLDLPPDRVPRLMLFLTIAIVQYAANALARATAEGLFLSHAGSSSIPLYLVIVGLTAVPTAGWMSRLIDRMPKVRLYRVSLMIAVGAAVVLRILVPIDTRPIWFVVLVGVVLMEMLLNIQFWVLVSDYFTTLEQKKLITVLTIALAAGGTMGGGLADGLVQVFRAPDLLLAFPLLYVVVFGMLFRLERTQVPLEPPEEEGGESLGGALRSLPKLLAEYPIITLMAVVGFLDVFLGAVGSYLSYDVYTRTFPNEHQMTEFLGTLKAVMCVLQVLIVTFVTRPLIGKLGVGRMNILYPLTTLGSFLGLGVRPGLPAAVGANINFDTVTSSLANPVENLTYNAVPPRFLGRVRSISEGMLQPAGLTVGGMLLAVVQGHWSFHQIVSMALGVSFVHVALGWWRGRKYVDSLAAQLRTRAVDLAGADGSRTPLPPGYAEEIGRLLESKETEAPAFGLELAARMGADRFLPVARPVLDRLEGRGREAGVSFLTAVRGRRGRRAVRALVDRGTPAVQSLVLEVLLRKRTAIPAKQLAALIESSDARVRGLARAASLLDSKAKAKPLLLHDPGLGEDGLAAVARGARAAEDRRLIPALVEAMVRGSAATRATALEGLVALTPLGERYASVVDLAAMELESDEPRVRAAAYSLLAKEDGSRLEEAAAGLQDSHARVRRRVAEVLGQIGEPAIPFLRPALESVRPEVVEAGLAALGTMRSQKAADAALDFLANDYRRVERNSRWRKLVPSEELAWEPLRLAIEDGNRKVTEKVLRVLASFGHSRILRHARQALHGRDVRLRANAVEALASIPHRRFVLPVLHVLEALATDGVEEAESGALTSSVPLDEMFACEDRWIRAAAAESAVLAGRPVPENLAADPDPIVAETARGLATRQETPMSRLLFLRRVSLFQELSLDDLLALDGALRRVDFLPEEVIFEEGSVGDDFYLISEGEVSIRTGPEREERARLGAGDFFGEMALFDDEPRSATCVAATACALLVLDRSRFYSLIEQLPQLGVAICRTLSQRLRRSEKELRAANAARIA